MGATWIECFKCKESTRDFEGTVNSAGIFYCNDCYDEAKTYQEAEGKPAGAIKCRLCDTTMDIGDFVDHVYGEHEGMGPMEYINKCVSIGDQEERDMIVKADNDYESKDNEPEEDTDDWDQELTIGHTLPQIDMRDYMVRKSNAMVQDEWLFKDVADIYASITNSNINVEFTNAVKDAETISSTIAKTQIYIPIAKNEVIKTQNDAEAWYLMRPIFRRLCKSDSRNLGKVESKLKLDGDLTTPDYVNSDSPLRKQYDKERKHSDAQDDLLRMIYNTVEDYRCTYAQAQMYLGVANDLKEIYHKMPQGVATNAMEALINTRFDRTDLVPPEMKGDVDFYKACLKLTEAATAKATMVATYKLFKYILPLMEEPPEPEDEPEPEPEGEDEEEQEGEGQGGTGGEGKDKDDNDKEEEEQDKDKEEQEQEQDKDTEKGGLKQPKGKGKGKKGEQEEDKEDQLTEQVDKTKKENERTGVNRNDDIETTQQQVDWDKQDEEVEDAQKKGKKQIQEIKEKIQENQEERQTKFIKQLDKHIIGNRGMYHTTRVEPDMALANRLAEAFALVKSKRVWIRSDYGNRINIDNVIKRRAGDSSVKMFEKRDAETGMQIVYCIDFSSSMDGHIAYTGGKEIEKAEAAKQLVLSMLAATKKVKGITNTIFTYAGNCMCKQNMDGRTWERQTCNVSMVDEEELAKMQRGGDTPSHLALYAAMKHCKKLGAATKKIIIHITDGAPNDREATTKIVELIKVEGIEMHTILIGANNTSSYYSIDDDSMAKTYGGPRMFTTIEDYADLRKIVSNTVAARIIQQLNI